MIEALDSSRVGFGNGLFFVRAFGPGTGARLK